MEHVRATTSYLHLQVTATRRPRPTCHTPSSPGQGPGCHWVSTHNILDAAMLGHFNGILPHGSRYMLGTQRGLRVANNLTFACVQRQAPATDDHGGGRGAALAPDASRFFNAWFADTLRLHPLCDAGDIPHHHPTTCHGENTRPDSVPAHACGRHTDRGGRSFTPPTFRTFYNSAARAPVLPRVRAHLPRPTFHNPHHLVGRGRILRNDTTITRSPVSPLHVLYAAHPGYR